MLSLYRALIRLRRNNDVLSVGEFRLVGAIDHVLAYERRLGDQRVLIALNMTRSGPGLAGSGNRLAKCCFRPTSTTLIPRATRRSTCVPTKDSSLGALPGRYLGLSRIAPRNCPHFVGVEHDDPYQSATCPGGRPGRLPAYVANGVVGLRVREMPLGAGLTLISGYSGEHPQRRIEAIAVAPYPVAGDIQLAGVWLSDAPPRRHHHRSGLRLRDR